MSLREIIAFGSLACGSLMAAHLFSPPPSTNLLTADVGLHQRTEPVEVVDARDFTAPNLMSTPMQQVTIPEAELRTVYSRPEMFRSIGTTNNSSLESEVALAIEIKTNLARLGCFSGKIDGRWTPTVSDAAEKLATRLNAILPTERPDHALLALARSQSTRVCDERPNAGEKANNAGLGWTTTLANSNDSSPFSLTADSSRMSLGAASTNTNLPSLSGSKAISIKQRQARRKSLSWAQERFMHPLGRQ